MKSVSKKLRLRWAKRLIGAKYFVAMTDSEAVIALDAADPNDIMDVVALAAQAAELELFHEKLGLLLKEHKYILKAHEKEQHAKTITVQRKASSKQPKKVQAAVRGAAQRKNVGQYITKSKV